MRAEGTTGLTAEAPTARPRRLTSAAPAARQGSSRRASCLAVIDADDPFVTALAAGAAAAGLRFWRSQEPIEPAAVVAMKLDTLMLDPNAVGGGWAYFEWICEVLPEVGVLVCTDRTSLAERVRGLRLGADDWLTKPAHPEEAIARAQAISRPRRAGVDPESPFGVGGLRLHPTERRAFIDGQDLKLSPQEFGLLVALARTSGEVIDRETIYRRVWGYAMAPGDRSVDVFVARLRARLAAFRPEQTYIHTHFRIGYRFDAGA